MTDPQMNGTHAAHYIRKAQESHGTIVRLQEENARLRARVAELEGASVERQLYVEVAHPRHARWEIVGESPARDGWVFAREVSTGQVLSFAPGQLRPHEPRDNAPAPTIHSSWQRPWSR